MGEDKLNRLEEFKGKYKKIFVVGAGSSIDLLPDKVFNSSSFLFIAINYSYIYMNDSSNYVTFCSDFNFDSFMEMNKPYNLPEPKNFFTEEDFNTSEEIDNKENTLISSITSGLRALDIAIGLQPENIFVIGLDYNGLHGNKIQAIFPKILNYDLPYVQDILKREVEQVKQLKEKVNIINLSPTSLIPQDMTVEDFVNGYIS